MILITLEVKNKASCQQTLLRMDIVVNMVIYFASRRFVFV